ncbi:MAG: hypothetical protein EA424_26610, partial [Planctomycetaceae bacterium]
MIALPAGFLQGIAFVDSNMDGQLDAGDIRKVGAEILLLQAEGDSWTQIESTTTDNNGFYRFSDLQPGTYRIKEIAPSGYVNHNTQILSQVNPAVEIDAQTIEVTLLDPSTIKATVDLDAFFASNKWAKIKYTLPGGQEQSTSLGQYPMFVSGQDADGNEVMRPDFLGACYDPYNFIQSPESIFKVMPSLAPGHSNLQNANVGALAHLYNNYFVDPATGEPNTLSQLDAVAVLLAIRELSFDPVPENGVSYISDDFYSGDFQVNTLLSGNPSGTPTLQEFVDQAVIYANEAFQQQDLAIFLEPVKPLNDKGMQGMIATHSLNFANVPANPAIDIQKATNGEDADAPTGPYILVGDAVTWTYVVTNTGNVALTDVVVTDDVLGAIGTIASFAPGASKTLTANGTAEPGQYANLGTAIGTPPVGPDVKASDPSHYFGAAPSLTIEKLTNGEDADDPTGPYILLGDPVTWEYIVTNTGNVDLVDVQVTDDVLGPIGTIPLLAPGQTQTLTAAGTAQAGQYVNLGAVTGTPPVGPDVTDSDPSHYFGATPAIMIEKLTNGEDADDPTGPYI